MLQAVKDGYGTAYLPESSAPAGIEAGHYCRVLEDWSEAFPADMIIPIMSITGSGKDNTDTLHEKGKSNITCCARILRMSGLRSRMSSSNQKFRYYC